MSANELSRGVICNIIKNIMGRKVVLLSGCALVILAAVYIGFHFSDFSEKARKLITVSSQNCNQNGLKTYNYNQGRLNFQFCYPDSWSVGNDSTPHPEQSAYLSFRKNDGDRYGFQLQTLPYSLDTLKNRRDIYSFGIFEPLNLDFTKINKGEKYLVLENTDSEVVFVSRGSPVNWNPPDTLYVYWYGQDPVRKNNTYEILYFFQENDDPAFILEISKTASIVSNSLLKNR